ncbi:hypothetical protein Tco_0185462 [Tanacetum coccineum]
MGEYDDEREDFETEFPAIVFNNTSDTTPPCEPTVSPPNENQIDFRISLDESDDEDYTVIFDENSFSYKIISVNDLKTDSEDGNGNMPTSPKPTVDYFDDLDYFKDFENEFPAIVYNDGLTSKSDLGTKPLVISECINEFNLIDETSLSEYDEEIVSRFNNLFNDIHHDDLKSEKDDEDDDISIIQSSEDNEISHGENVFFETNHDKTIKTFEKFSFVINLNIVIWSYYGMLLFLIINLYVPYGIPFDPKRYYKDGSHTNVAEAKIWHHYPLLIKGTHGLDMRSRDIPRRRLFGIHGPLVREFILEFLSTCRMSDTKMGLDVADMLCFQLGGAKRRMTWRQFILALGLHTEQEMAEAGGQAPEKVTGVDLFYLRNMDCGTTNVPHVLAQYLFRHAEGRKSRARLSGGHFIGRLAMHFRLVSDEGLRGLQPRDQRGSRLLRLVPNEADEAGPGVEEVALEIPAPA